MTTKLSDLLALPAIPESAFGVEVDVESFTPPQGLKEIGLRYKAEGGDIDVTRVDVVISYTVSGVGVILEIPAEAEGVDAKYTMSLAANMGISLALLPPASDDPALAAAYVERVGSFAAAFLGHANFSGEVLPVTSYLEYMFVERLKDASSFAATDPYIVENFVEATSAELVDRMKAAIRDRVHAHFGGEEGFANFSTVLFAKIRDRVEGCCRDMVAQAPQEATA